MEEHIFYRIISKQPKNPTPFHNSNQFHRSAPYKMYHKNNQTSLTFLSSLIQTQNLIHNKINPNSINFTSRQFNPKKIQSQIDKRLYSQNLQKEIFQPNGQFSKKNIKKNEQINSSVKKLSKKQNALCNLLGEVDVSTIKIENKIMENTIHKARTYTLMPNRINAISLYKKKQNQVQLKEDFNNFVGKQDFKSHFVTKLKEKGTVSTTQYIKRKPITEPSQKIEQKGDLYHFLNPQQAHSKRLKTDTTKNYPTLSKRMVQMMLKKQLGIYNDTFSLAQMGNRKTFKLNGPKNQ